MTEEPAHGVSISFIVQVVMGAALTGLVAGGGFLAGKTWSNSETIAAEERDIAHDEQALKDLGDRFDRMLSLQADIAGIKSEVGGLVRGVDGLTSRFDAFVDPPHGGIK